jgi:hypothetical protein
MRIPQRVTPISLLPLLRHNLAPQPPATTAASTGPVYVVVADSRAAAHPGSSAAAGGSPAYRIEQLPAGCTTGELARRLSEGAPRGEAQAPLRMLVRCPGDATLPTYCGKFLFLILSCGELLFGPALLSLCRTARGVDPISVSGVLYDAVVS